MLELRKVQPLFCQVLVTEELFGYDDVSAGGVIVSQKGDIKPYQTVVAVGSDVTQVKPGDVVKINFAKYAILKEDPNSVKAINDNAVVKLRLNEVEMTDAEGNPVMCMLIDQRDIQYIMEDFDEVCYNKDDELVKIGKTNLILPSKRIVIP